MRTTNSSFCQKTLVLAVAMAFAPMVFADDAVDMAALTQPSSSVSVGVGAMTGDTKDRSIFGQYNGLKTHDTNGLFDVDVVKRDNATGTWMILKGNNLGLDNQDVSATYEKQGSWRVTGSYNEITHHELRTINTADTGVGTTTPVIHVLTPSAIGTGSDINLQLKRKGLGLGGEVWLTPSLLFQVDFKNEDKDGARFTGKGYDCAGTVCGPTPALTGAASTAYQAANLKNAILMQAEPVHFNTKQVDLKLSFAADKLNINGGYYGSFFKNSNGSVNMTVPDHLYGGNGTTLNPLYPAVAGGTSLQNVLQLPFALAPDNEAHQFYVDGNYAFTKTTKATFKYAYTHATQDEGYSSMGLTGAPAGASSLGGEVNTTLVQLGLTSRPLPKLHLSANIRYEDKDDKTPQYLYNKEGTSTWYNGLTSGSKLNGKLEASYMLPADYRMTLGYDYNRIKREVPKSAAEDLVAGLSALRERTTETGYRAELSRMMSEAFTGTIGFSSSSRRGSDWTNLCTNAACTAAGLTYAQSISAGTLVAAAAAPTSIFPMSMADMDKDKWKVSANWNPTERLSLQFLVEDGRDKNVTAINSIAGGKGFRGNDDSLYSIDASYIISDAWQLTGYLSQGNQSLDINHSTGYLLNLNDKTDAVGLALKGQINAKIEMGAKLDYTNDVTHYGVKASPSATGAAASATNLAQAAIGLPDVEFRQTTLSLYGKYALDKSSDLRLDLIHQRAKLKEWSWGNNGVPFVYADNTTVNLQENQNVTFLGVRYQFRFH